MAGDPPILHLLAGPNGAGKSTLYREWVAPYTNAPFVNADLLIFELLGRHPRDREEAELGQRLANTRREALMDARRHLVTETVFSHVSKLELVKDAQARGYVVTLYHVGVESPEVSIRRVAIRQADGGHGVPEASIRARYERNQPLIREAALLAERAFIFDNSVAGRKPRLHIDFKSAAAVNVIRPLPRWVAKLYGADVKSFRRR